MDSETIRTLTIKASTDGVDQATASLNKLSDATVQVATVSETSSRSTLSIQSALDRQQKSLDSTYKSQQQYAAAESVLSKARDQGLIGLDRYNQLLGLAADKYTQASGGSKLLQGALSGVSGQIVALSAGAGPVGTFLAGLGPWGVAGALAIRMASGALGELDAAADRAGKRAQGLHDLSETLGLTTTQLQGLQLAAAGAGVSTDIIDKAFEKFTINVEQLRSGTGTLYDQMLKINPAILLQMASTRDAATEWDLYSKAVASASEEQKNALTNAAFGRGGVSVGRVASSTLASGGLNAVGNTSAQSASSLTKAQVDLWANLKTEIERASTAASDTWGKLYSQEVLQNQVQTAQNMERLATAAANFQASPSLQSFFDLMKQGTATIGQYGFGPLVSQIGATHTEMNAARRNLATGLNAGQRSVPAGAWPGPQENPTPVAKEGGQGDKTSDAYNANTYKQTIAALGQAATPAEQFKLKLDDVKKALADHVLTADQAARANGVLNESFKVDQLRAMISALGAAATPAEQYKVSVDSLHLELDRGMISQTTYNRAVANAANTYNQAMTAGRERLGLLSDEELHLNAVRDIQDALSKGFIKSSDDMAAAQVVLAKSIKGTSDRMQVLRSPLPGLAQLGLDAGNLSKQLDTLSTTSINNLGNGLADILTGTTTLSAGMKSLEQQFTKSLINMVYQMTVAAPLAKGLQGLLGGFLPGGLGVGGGAGGVNPVVPGATNVVGVNGNIPVPTFHTGGIIGQIGASRYVHPAYFDDAPRFHSGGIAGDEVPVIARKGEGVFTPGQMAAMGGGGGSVTVHTPINVTLQGGSGDDAQARKFASQIAGSVKKVALDTIRDQLRQGGVLHKAAR